MMEEINQISLKIKTFIECVLGIPSNLMIFLEIIHQNYQTEEYIVKLLFL